MQKMKLLLIFILVFTAANCSEKKSFKQNEINIVVSIPPFADFVKNIVGGEAIYALLLGGVSMIFAGIFTMLVDDVD